MELIDLFRTLRRRWIVVLITALWVVSGGLFLLSRQEDRYEAAASLIVTPAPTATPGNQSAFVVPNAMPALEVRLDSRTFREAAVARVPVAFASAAVTIDGESDPGTGLFRIVAKSAERDAVAPWANAFAQEFIATNPFSTTISVAALDAAIEPDSAESSAGAGIVVALVALALICGVLAALAANALARRDPAAEIRRRYRIDVLGEIPAGARAGRSSPLSPIDLFTGDAQPRVMEAFQSLRAEIEILVHSRGIESIAITSLLPFEGKTTVSANLSWALASVGHKVTLVDCDLRNPSLHNVFGFSRFSDGVSDVLDTDAVRLSELARTTALPGLNLITAGVPTRHPAEILGPSLGKLMPEFAGPDRLMILDAPPVEGVAETRTIAAAAGAVLFVIDGRRKTDVEEVERAIQIITGTGATLLGVVLNRAKVRRRKETARYVLPKPRAELEAERARKRNR